MQDEQHEQQRSAASVRTVEIATAAVIFLCGALVAFDSFRLGARWGDDGPQAGYFPFYVGLPICIAAPGVVAGALRERALPAESLVQREQLKMIPGVLLPTLVYASL